MSLKQCLSCIKSAVIVKPSCSTCSQCSAVLWWQLSVGPLPCCQHTSAGLCVLLVLLPMVKLKICIPRGFVWSTELPDSCSLMVQALDSAGTSAFGAEQPVLVGGGHKWFLGQKECPGCGGRWECLLLSHCCLFLAELPGPAHHSASLPAQGSLSTCWRDT